MNFKRFNVASAITLGLLILFGALALLDGLSPVYAENAPDAIAEVVVGNAPLRANISGTWTHDGVEDEWEQGTPDNAANGAPRHCASGPEGCWVTDLGDSYNDDADESLYSPVITVPVTATLPVSVTWRQAWYIEDAYYDRAYADYRCNGGAWTNLWQHYSDSQTGSNAEQSWQIAPGAPFSLSCGLTDTVQFRFRLTSDDSNNFPGYYVDDLRLYDAAGKTLYSTQPPQLSKTAQQAQIQPGDRVTYTLQMTNTRETSRSFTLVDTLDGNQSPLGALASRGACRIAAAGWGGVITCAIPAVQTDERVVVTLTAQSAAAISTFNITNSATVSDGLQTASAQTSVAVDNCFVRLAAGGAYTAYNTVQAAIDAAAPGDEVQVSGVCGDLFTRNGKTQIGYISKTLTLRGGYNTDFSEHNPAQYPATLDAQGLGRVFYITKTAAIEDFTLTNGSGGAIYADIGKGDALVFRANTFYNNASSGSGGGIYVYGGYSGTNYIGRVTVQSNTIRNNNADYGGGLAIGVIDKITVTGNIFRENAAQQKGGGFQIWQSNAMRVTDNAVLSNTASEGGGVLVDDYAAGALVSNTIAHNKATTGNGGGVLQEDHADYTLENNDIFSNTAAGNGGGIYALGDSGGVSGPFRYRFNDIAYNHSVDGGGIYIRGNACNAAGLLQGNLIRHNAASGDGGGLFIIDCEQLGGFVNNAVINNSAAGIGGGIRIHRPDFPNWKMIHNTIGNNTGGDNSGVYIGGGADSILSNTLIYSQTFGVVVDGNGSNGTLDYTFWDGGVTTHTATSNSGAMIESNALQGNAALSADGYHLPGNSAAINQGKSDTPADIDRQNRDDGQPDIGADEYVASVDPALNKTRQGSGNVISGQPITYTLTVSNSATAEDQVSVILTDTLSPVGAAAGVRFKTVGGDHCASNATGFTCTVYNVATNTQRIVTAIITTGASFVGQITNTARLSALTGAESNPANNSAGPVVVTVAPPASAAPNLWVNKSASAQYVKSGDALTYTLRWGNRGDATAANAVLTDTLPAAVNFVSATGSPARNGQILTWHLGNVLSNTALTYRVVVSVQDNLADGTVLTNTAVISAAAEADSGDNASAVGSVVYATGGISLTVTKDALGIVNDEVRVGDVVNYRVVVSNSGAVSTPFLLEDNIPQGATYVDGSVWSEPPGPGAVYVAASHKIYWNHTAVLTANKAVTVHFQVKVADCDGSNLDGVLRNIAAVRVSGVSRVWQSPPRDLWVQCPNLALDIANIHQAEEYDYLHYKDAGLQGNGAGATSFLVYGNIDRGAHLSLAANPRITLTLSGNAHFKPTGISPAPVEAAAQRIVWNLPQAAPGETVDGANAPAFAVIPDGYDENGYKLQAEIGDQNGLSEASWELNDNSDTETYPSLTMDFEKQALPPKVMWLRGPQGEPLEVRFELGFQMLLRYRNSNPNKPAAYDIEIDDNWDHFLPLDENRGQLASWGSWVFRKDAAPPYHVYWSASRAIEGSPGWIKASGYLSQTTPPGTQFDNFATLKFRPGRGLEDTYSGFYEEKAQASVQTPLLQPVILSPQPNIRMCPGETLSVYGIAQRAATVKIYLNGALKATVQPNALGTFTATLTAVSGNNLLEVSAAYNGAETPRSSVTVSAPGNLLWAPYGSSVMGTVAVGPLKGEVQVFDLETVDDFQLPGIYGLSDMSWNLRTCGCPRPATDVMSVTVSADGGQYVGSASAAGDKLDYADAMVEHAHRVDIAAMCYDPSAPPPPKPGNPDDPADDDANTQNSSGEVLIDPDGYVFDIDRGGAYDSGSGGMFIPVQAVGGVTVTAYMSVPTWGSWIPWPAHLYHQVNPQVTDNVYPDGITATGYYAFYTPPGQYYLQVEGISGYQAWRSPVINVVTQAVHVNVPYTPLPQSAAVTVTLTAQSVSAPVVTVPVGSAVQWVSSLSASDTITNLIAWGENPVLHPKSQLNPLLNPRGFDAGYLEPGRVYRREFAAPGVYSYTVAGRSGKVIVTDGSVKIYLPLIIK